MRRHSHGLFPRRDPPLRILPITSMVGKLGESEEGRKRLEAAKRSELPKRFRKAEELKVRTEGYECRFDTGPSLGRTVVVFIGVCCTKA